MVKKRLKFCFKKIIKLNKMFLFNFKILNFKKKKWEMFLINLKNQLIKNKYKKFKFVDQNKLLLNLYSNKFNNYKNRYKHLFLYFKIIKFFYFNTIKNLLFLNSYKKLNIYLLNLFKIQFDYLLYQSKFCLSIQNARYYIKNNWLIVNNKKINKIYYKMQPGDLVSFTQTALPLINFIKLKKWSLPFLNLVVNFNSMEILFVGNFQIKNFALYFPLYLNLNKIF